MKKLLALLLVLTMMLTLTGCKNKAVKNAEELISSIGEVTLDSGEAISAARTAYDALTEKEVAKVENYALLTEAEATLTALEEEKARLEAEQAEYEAVCEWLKGEWVDNTKSIFTDPDLFHSSAIIFSADGTCETSGKKYNWTYDNGIIQIGAEGVTVEYTIEEKDGISYLSHSYANMVKWEDLDKIYVTVELTPENISDYIELVDMPYERTDDFGEIIAEGTMPWMRSKVYDSGLIYIGANDLTIEINTQLNNRDYRMITNRATAFGPIGDYPDYWIYEDYHLSAADCTFNRVKGTLVFVKAEFAKTEWTKEERTVSVFEHEVASRGTPFYSNYNLLEGDYLNY